MASKSLTLEGKHVLVVGGSSGLGFAAAQLAREFGAEVTIASSTAAKVAAAVDRLPGARGETVDLKDEGSIVGLLGRIEPLDHLVITGGDKDPRVFAPTDQLDSAIVRDALEARLLGSFAFIRHGHAQIAPGGSITLTTGVLAHRPRKGAPLPTAIMGAVEHLVRGFAVDLAPLRINAVCPGLTLTEMIIPSGSDRIKAMTAGLPLPRAATPLEAAQAYLYLILNAYITGQILPVDGGGALV